MGTFAQAGMRPTPRPPSTRLSWDEVHRLEVLMRTRAVAMSTRTSSETTCGGCGGPLGGEGMRVAGVWMHPHCLPGMRGDQR
jgi:hypothetical protein